jgi:hypothetical protein
VIAVTPLFKKLNLGDFRVIHVLNAPDSFEPELRALTVVTVRRSVDAPFGFALAFVTTLAGVQKAAAQLSRAAAGDALLWMAYPKASSRKYKCEFNRDTGWSSLGQAGYEPVRQVAIDDDWSALRFRKTEFIKSMKRNPEGAISAAGRKKSRERREE